VSQKFQLAIDLQYEEATIGVVPEISADVSAEALAAASSTSISACSTTSFRSWRPPPVEPPKRAKEDALALARDYVSKGLMELAAAEATRACSAAQTAPKRAWSWAISTRAAACTAKRWSVSAKRGPWTPRAPTRASAK